MGSERHGHCHIISKDSEAESIIVAKTILQALNIFRELSDHIKQRSNQGGNFRDA